MQRKTPAAGVMKPVYMLRIVAMTLIKQQICVPETLQKCNLAV